MSIPQIEFATQKKKKKKNESTPTFTQKTTSPYRKQENFFHFGVKICKHQQINETYMLRGSFFFVFVWPPHEKGVNI